MLNLSRWADTGGSYRTVQRWFSTAIPWAEVFWLFLRQHLLRPQDEYILAGDEVVVTKAGTQTFGLDRFFSSLFQKPVPGPCLLRVVVGQCDRASFVSATGRAGLYGVRRRKRNAEPKRKPKRAKPLPHPANPDAPKEARPSRSRRRP